MLAKLAGDYFNATPVIANNLVFVAYQRYVGRQSVLQVVNADTGEASSGSPLTTILTSF